MLSSRPYLVRALYDWIVDSDWTPYLLVDASHPDCNIPEDYINGSEVVLNISPRACRGLIMDNDKIIFTTRFSGMPVQLSFSPEAVTAIYAKENGRGMIFNDIGADGNTGSEDENLEAPTEVLWEFDTPPADSDEKTLSEEGSSNNIDRPVYSTELKDVDNPSKKKSTSKKKPFLTVVK